MTRQQRRREIRDIEKELFSYGKRPEFKKLTQDKELVSVMKYHFNEGTQDIVWDSPDMPSLKEGKHENADLQKRYTRLITYLTRINELQSRLQWLKDGAKEEPIKEEPILSEA